MFLSLGFAFLFLTAHGKATCEYEQKTNKPTQVLTPIRKFCTEHAKTCPYLLDRLAWPFLNETSPKAIRLNVTFEATNFIGIGELEQRFSMQGSIMFTWHMPNCSAWFKQDDPCLNYFDVESLLVGCGKPAVCLYEANRIWHPKFQHFNRIGEETVFDRGNEYVTISGDGEAMWIANGLFESACFLTFKKFPFDRQTCTIDIALKDAVEAFLVVFQSAELLFDAETVFSNSSLWRFESKGAVTKNMRFPLSRFEFVLSRRWECYLGNIFIPMALLIAIQVSVFAMPAAMPDRAALSATTFVAFSILLGVINVDIPKTPETMYLVVNFAAQMALAAAVTIYALATCRLAKHRKKTFSKRISIIPGRSCLRMRLIDLVDLVAFFITLMLYATVIIAFLVSVT